MIVVRVEGGLGNQMFQVAFGMQLSARHKCELVLDLTSYDQRPEHGYLLDRFGVTARRLRQDELRRVPRRFREKKHPAKNKRWSGLSFFAFDGLRRVREKPFGFAEEYLLARDDSYLVGYWQSERFFPDVAAQVRREFQPLAPLSAQSARLRERMLDRPSVSLHIRRGDYVTNAQASAIYRSLSIDYYRGCVSSCLEACSGVEVVVFSNDIAWCRQQLALPCPVHFVEHTTRDTAHEDLWLMTAAQCHIIANSTFSWWGAWLGQRPGHRVFAPRHWFRPGTLDDRGLACEGWQLVDDPGQNENPIEKLAAA